MKLIANLAFASFFCLVGLSNVHGQSRFALSANLAPIYAQSNASASIPIFDPVNPDFGTLKSNSYRLVYSLGIMARYSFSPKWSVSTGIWASHPFAGRDRITQNTITTTIPYEYKRPFHNQYKAPLLVNFRFSDNRVSPYISAGTTFDFRSKTYVVIDGMGTEVGAKFGKAVVVTPLLGLGAIIDLKEHLSAIVQPTVQYDVQPLNGLMHRNAFQLSLQTQLMYRF